MLVRGMTGDRYAVTCNGRTVPLAPTGTFGEAVAGVRYRAWAPPSALHPTIGTHVPLVFDIFDRWTGRSIAGCRYHVSHPGGRSSESFPINSYEAEGRRLARFEANGHTAGTHGAAAHAHQSRLSADARPPPAGLSHDRESWGTGVWLTSH